MSTDPSSAITAVRQWIEDIVIGLNLCPFAAKVYFAEQVRYVVCNETDVEELLTTIGVECQRLLDNQGIDWSTSLVIAPNLSDFDTYLDVLALAEEFITRMGWDGVFQLASFHPDYLFAEQPAGDVSHYTNRSPLPIFHILRESDISQVLANYDQPEDIPERNMLRLRELGLAVIQSKLEACQRILRDGSSDRCNH